MAQNDFQRFSRKVVQYFWDPPPRNEDPSLIWCLGRSYDSRYQESRQQTSKAVPGTSPATSDSSISQADSAVVTENPIKKDEETEVQPEMISKSEADLTRSEEEALGWPTEFLDDLESRIWLTYRSNFPPIPRSQDPNVNSGLSFASKLRNLGSQNNFTSDTGWGCMIRSGQSLLANALAITRFGREWRKGQREREHKQLLGLFADVPSAPYSIHRFVEHGASACGKGVGEWFGPSAVARCLQALTQRDFNASIRVYARPDDANIYLPSLLKTATSDSDTFHPTLIVLGIRLGLSNITPIYYPALSHALSLPQSIGIAGGRPSSSHYFLGFQGEQFFYLDPHTTRPALSSSPTAEEVESCHTRRVRRIAVGEMDPSMLIGFLVKDKEDLDDWVRRLRQFEGRSIVQIHDEDERQGYLEDGERESAVDEVESCDEIEEEEEEEEADERVEVEREGLQ